MEHKQLEKLKSLGHITLARMCTTLDGSEQCPARVVRGKCPFMFLGCCEVTSRRWELFLKKEKRDAHKDQSV